MLDVSRDAARKVAYLAALANILAGALLLFVLQRGLPPRDLLPRAAFISSHQAVW